MKKKNQSKTCILKLIEAHIAQANILHQVYRAIETRAKKLNISFAELHEHLTSIKQILSPMQQLLEDPDFIAALEELPEEMRTNFMNGYNALIDFELMFIHVSKTQHGETWKYEEGYPGFIRKTLPWNQQIPKA